MDTDGVEQTANSLIMPELDFNYLSSASVASGARNTSNQLGPSPAPAKPRKLRIARLARLDNDTKAKVSRSVLTSHVKSWLHHHGYVVKADKLHPAVTRVIAEWFDLVDEDGSRTLEHHELLAALKAAKIPCDDNTIQEMINMMDMNRDGVIGWDEFEVFMTEEFAAGKQLLSGEYLLPSGLAINFGVMIGKLKRDKLMGDVQDNSRRSKWADIASDPELLGRELAVMQEAAEATSLTLEHLKRQGDTGEEVVATPRTVLTNALLKEMDSTGQKERERERSGTPELRPTRTGFGQGSGQAKAAHGLPPSRGASPAPGGHAHTHGRRGRATPDPAVQHPHERRSATPMGQRHQQFRASSPGPAPGGGFGWSITSPAGRFGRDFARAASPAPSCHSPVPHGANGSYPLMRGDGLSMPPPAGLAARAKHMHSAAVGSSGSPAGEAGFGFRSTAVGSYQAQSAAGCAEGQTAVSVPCATWDGSAQDGSPAEPGGARCERAPSDQCQASPPGAASSGLHAPNGPSHSWSGPHPFAQAPSPALYHSPQQQQRNQQHQQLCGSHRVSSAVPSCASVPTASSLQHRQPATRPMTQVGAMAEGLTRSGLDPTPHQFLLKQEQLLPHGPPHHVPIPEPTYDAQAAPDALPISAPSPLPHAPSSSLPSSCAPSPIPGGPFAAAHPQLFAALASSPFRPSSSLAAAPPHPRKAPTPRSQSHSPVVHPSTSHSTRPGTSMRTYSSKALPVIADPTTLTHFCDTAVATGRYPAALSSSASIPDTGRSTASSITTAAGAGVHHRSRTHMAELLRHVESMPRRPRTTMDSYTRGSATNGPVPSLGIGLGLVPPSPHLPGAASDSDRSSLTSFRLGGGGGVRYSVGTGACPASGRSASSLGFNEAALRSEDPYRVSLFGMVPGAAGASSGGGGEDSSRQAMPSGLGSVSSTARDPVALLSERRAVVRAATGPGAYGAESAAGPSPYLALPHRTVAAIAAVFQTPSATGAHPGERPDGTAPVLGSTLDEGGRHTNSCSAGAHTGAAALAAAAVGEQEWISYTRLPATAQGPSPLAHPAVHAHAFAPARSPSPRPAAAEENTSLPADAPPATLAVEQLGSTAAVISAAQTLGTGAWGPLSAPTLPAWGPPVGAAGAVGGTASPLVGGVASSRALRPSGILAREREQQLLQQQHPHHLPLGPQGAGSGQLSSSTCSRSSSLSSGTTAAATAAVPQAAGMLTPQAQDEYELDGEVARLMEAAAHRSTPQPAPQPAPAPDPAASRLLPHAPAHGPSPSPHPPGEAVGKQYLVDAASVPNVLCIATRTSSGELATSMRHPTRDQRRSSGSTDATEGGLAGAGANVSVAVSSGEHRVVHVASRAGGSAVHASPVASRTVARGPSLLVGGAGVGGGAGSPVPPALRESTTDTASRSEGGGAGTSGPGARRTMAARSAGAGTSSSGGAGGSSVRSSRSLGRSAGGGEQQQQQQQQLSRGGGAARDDLRPVSRPASQLCSYNAEKEGLAQTGWRAATASKFQEQLSRYLSGAAGADPRHA